MKTELVIFFLSIQSSYANNTEIDATATAFDTIQFLSVDGACFRVKTFAQDQDVHIWSIGSIGRDVQDLVALANENTIANYGDVMAQGCVIETDDGIEGIRRELLARGLKGQLEEPRPGLFFWAPGGKKYRSKSTPA